MSNTSDMKDAFKFIPKDAGIVVDESKSQPKPLVTICEDMHGLVRIYKV